MDKVVAVVVAGGVLYLVYKVVTGPDGGVAKGLEPTSIYEKRPQYLDKNYRNLPIGTNINNFRAREQEYFKQQAKLNIMRLDTLHSSHTNPQQFLDIHA